MSRSIAVIGAGPSGFYAVDGLVRALPDARIDIIDRLPCPYGLVRYGVAPDHQGTKAVQRQFERLLAKPIVRFIGNVEVGRDVAIADLAALYDALIIATGCSRDRRLGIPGEDLAGVVGSGAFVGWYNGHPDFAELDPLRPDMHTVAVIGAGNVAIDVARVLAKTADEMVKSDIAPHAAAAIAGLDLTEISLVARRGPADANFTGNELAEMSRLAAFQATVQSEVLDGVTAPDSDPAPERMRKAKNLELLRSFAAADTPRRLRFQFWGMPVALHGVDGKVRELELADTRHPERRWRQPADLVVTCIGYDPSPPVGLLLERGHIAHDDGRVRDLPGAYVVGWAKRGPTGVIPTNRADSLALVKVVVDDLAAPPASEKAGPGGLDALLSARGVRIVDSAAWRRIETAENAAGQAEGRPRVKLGTWRLLEQAAHGEP
ncbi:FAD-dependent oxidoreductase [Reyranella sp. CPCC 100927]|uniref:FAD-dependent oxidoreductase n=1 Tax=Reyranella sp. CPCC 100927 TaxID=2599616 RepID=UPI0011B668D6|nr:FAD-dependent oxidoreductase [Reyranella sp. CPCC 100927]TWT02679.1 ferredoxin-NADP reductase [Reyranella sp. CPCC 100927]